MSDVKPIELVDEEFADLVRGVVQKSIKARVLNTRVFDLSGFGPREVFSDDNKVRRNDPCICGSGKKFKKCCGRS